VRNLFIIASFAEKENAHTTAPLAIANSLYFVMYVGQKKTTVGYGVVM